MGPVLFRDGHKSLNSISVLRLQDINVFTALAAISDFTSRWQQLSSVLNMAARRLCFLSQM